MARYVDISKATIPKGFFEDLNVPKFLNWLNSQPTADVVEVRHAEWIWVEDGVDDYEQYWVCSVCKEKTYFETKFCSECGAKMDKGVTK